MKPWIEHIHKLQGEVCDALEGLDGKAKFFEDAWERPGGGGGKTRVMQHGSVFEKAGVNTSVVFGEMNETMRNQLSSHNQFSETAISGFKAPHTEAGLSSWFACGISVVVHPVNPFVPTIHCNYRMFELYNERHELKDRWFGGGTDLTPTYLIEEDAIHFHQTYKDTCDKFDKSFYPKFKQQCDNYFVNWHRNDERRGIGGIFYDYQRPDATKDVNFWMDFGKACGDSFLNAYISIVQKRMNTPYNTHHKKWQEIRRGRYVEFNLIHDRGTLFGLKTNGRTESILMSLPPVTRFEYDYQPDPFTEEDKLLQVCLHPRDWIEKRQT